MATVARGHVAGGFTVPAAAWLATTKCTASAASASTKKGKRKKGSPEGPGSGQSTSKRSKTTGGSEGASRARLTIKQKIEVVRLLDKRISHEEIADRFGCATRTARKIKAEREKVQKEAAIAGRDDMRTARQGEFSQVGYTTSTAVLHRLRPCSPLFFQIVFFRAHYFLWLCSPSVPRVAVQVYFRGTVFF